MRRWYGRTDFVGGQYQSRKRILVCPTGDLIQIAKEVNWNKWQDRVSRNQYKWSINLNHSGISTWCFPVIFMEWFQVLAVGIVSQNDKNYQVASITIEKHCKSTRGWKIQHKNNLIKWSLWLEYFALFTLNSTRISPIVFHFNSVLMDRIQVQYRHWSLSIQISYLRYVSSLNFPPSYSPLLGDWSSQRHETGHK